MRYMLIGMILGVGAEIVARTLRVWLYRRPLYALVNIVGMFGIVMGSIAALVPRHGVLPAFATAFLVGLAYEILNLRVLRWWHFPDERLASPRSHAAVVVVLGLLWGLAPLATVGVHAAAQRALPNSARQTPLGKLNELEKGLLERQEALRRKQQDTEARLEDVRRRKRLLLEPQPVRRPGVPDQGPEPTP